jgi:hypothetical protein
MFHASSQPKQSMADAKDRFKRYFSPERLFWGLKLIKIQAPMWPVVVPIYKLVK